MLAFSCILILLLLVGISLSLRRSVRSMLSSPEAHENPDAAAPLLACVPHEFQALLDAEGFRFTRAYSFNATTFGIWIRISAEPPLRFFSVLKGAGGVAHEFVTSFSDDASLTTTTARSAFIFPLPFGTFMQCFPSATPEALWKAHRTGEDHIISVIGVPVRESRMPFLEAFKLGVIRKLSYVISLRLWSVRGVYWYLIRRFLLHNRPIWRQNIEALYGKVFT